MQTEITIQLDDDDVSYGVRAHEALLNQIRQLIEVNHPHMVATITDHTIEREVKAIGEDHHHDIQWEEMSRINLDAPSHHAGGEQRGECTGCGAIFRREWELTDAEQVGDPENIAEVTDADAT